VSMEVRSGHGEAGRGGFGGKRRAGGINGTE
jgi:hypothetical protein